MLTHATAMPHHKPLLILLMSTAALLIACSSNQPTASTSTDTPHTADTTDTAVADTAKLEGNIRIAAASNLADTLPIIVDDFQAAYPDAHIEVSFASSGKLYAQIQEGAPYDIYLAANQDYPAKLADSLARKPTEQQADTATDAPLTPFTYTQGQLAVYSTVLSFDDTPDVITQLATLSQDSGFKLTIANPELAPYGAAAKSYLESKGIYNTLQSANQLVLGENISQTFQFTHTGHASVGMVALSQVLSASQTKPKVSGSYKILDAGSYPAIKQDGMVINHSVLADGFVDYLLSDVGQATLAKAGYTKSKN